MILSQTAVYAARAVIHLAQTADRGHQPVDDIAEALGVPRNYLSKILQGLARAGILDSTRGPRGGFVLARPATRVSLADVVAPFDDIATSSGCLLGREACRDDNPCAAHEHWRDLSRRLRAFLSDTTIDELARGRTGLEALEV